VRGYGDCDGDLVSGCEVDFVVNVVYCGVCGYVCVVIEMCIVGVCVCMCCGCLDWWRDCDMCWCSW
jgi:hypothetical protein